MRACSVLIRYLVAFCWLSQAGWAAVFAEGPPADLTGTYEGHAPAADAAKRVFTLNLAADGTASLTTLYIGKDDTTQHGRWTQSGSQVVMTFDAMGPNRPPHPITFRHHGHELRPLHWDPSEWGRVGPPILHRSRASQGGY